MKIKTGWLVLPAILLSLQGCSGGVDSQSATSNTQTSEIEESKPLNLSLPETDLSTEVEFTVSEKEAPDFFKKSEEEKKVSVSGKPNLNYGENITDVPELDGGTVNVKVKLD